MPEFIPGCRPLLIGSLPLDSHDEAMELIWQYTPELPLWPQLPSLPQEGMIRQYLSGMVGLATCDDTVYVDGDSPTFEAEVLQFYEDYLSITEAGADLEKSRFVLHQKDAAGFYTLLRTAEAHRHELQGLKGQTTGPFTFATGLVDQNGKAIFYNDQLRDIAIKLLAMKAKYQTRKMARLSGVPIMFFDEPALAGLGSSAFITISEDDIVACLTEVCDAVRSEKGLTGVHVCANTEWPVIFNSGVDIVSFDAYSYFDKLVLYGPDLRRFFAGGGVLASGIVPTETADLDRETVDSLADKWHEQCDQLVALGIDRETVFNQSLITPSCGTGAISLDYALQVLQLTKDLAARIRNSR